VSNGDSEFALIDWFRQYETDHPRVPVGIGDDAAVVSFPTKQDTLITVDMLIEGVHFTVPPATARQVGRKVLAVNLSDIAAMAGRPLAAVVSVAASRNRGAEFVRQLYLGMKNLADRFDVSVVGGDTNVWHAPAAVSVTVLGEVTGTRPVCRRDAQIGDWIFVTGTFGGSLAAKQFEFQPRVKEAIELHQRVNLHAMTDVSDGLSTDLHNILDESHVAAVVYEQAIPISDVAKQIQDEKTPLEHALSDGEDFELLFTVTAKDGQSLLESPPFDILLSRIGKIVKGCGCQTQDAVGNRKELHRTGWEHKL